MSIFIAQLFPRDMVKEIRGASQAGINFCHNFIEAIQPKKTYAYQLNSVQENLNISFSNKAIKYISCRIFPHKSIFKALNVAIENYTIIRDINRNNYDNIWFYNMTPQVMLLFAYLRFINNKNCFIILADYTPELFRNKIAKILLNKSSGIVALSSEIEKILNKNVRIISKSGLVSDKLANRNASESDKNTFLFSGSLSEYTGIDLALEAFSQLPELTLAISGRGPSEELIKLYCAKYPNIHYYGFVSFDDYLCLLDSAEYVLSLRDPNLGKNLYNFPSKIIEYFMRKKVVISTKKYNTIDSDIYIYSEYSTEQLKESIVKTTHLPQGELNNIKNKAYNFVNTNFSFKSWQQTINQLENNS